MKTPFRMLLAKLGLVIALACAVVMVRPAAAQRRGPDTAANTVLDTASVWRIYAALKPPMIQYADGAKPLASPYQWVDKETPTAPEGWTQTKFAADSWLRTTAAGQAHSPYVAQLALRGKFEVTDPAQVKDLKLSIAYHGGVIVYLNGEEIGRGHLAKDAKSPNSLAETYPLAAFANEKGELIEGGRDAKDVQKIRARNLDIALPAGKLQPGVNTLAIEVLRAPYDKIVADYWKVHAKDDRRELKEPGIPYDLNWYTCEILDVQLTASGPGILPNASRPKTLQAWNSDLLTPDTANDLADRCEPLHAVALQGPRNGYCSGKIVLGSPQPIAGLKVTCSALTQGAATIPAAALRARYGVAFGEGDRSPLESLLETPLESFPVGPAGAAVVPVWFTVKVPASAKPGAYAGQATVEIKGEKALTVPLTLQVADYAVPDTQDYRTWIDVMQSPDTLAKEYNVPLWSDQHWALVAESFRYIGEIGSRMLQIPLIAQTNSGNTESMVRWIKKADGTYDYDLTNVDKYLDLAQKNMGTPKFVAFIAWEIYLDTPKAEVTMTDAERNNAFRAMEKSWAAARWDLRGKGPAVTALDPETKQIATVNLPRFEDPAAKIAWKPLFDALHKRLAQRGLEKTMLLGMASDRYPSKDEMPVLEDVSGNLPWMDQGHGGSLVGSKLDGIATQAYNAYVWNCEYPKDPSTGRTYGWKRPQLYLEFRRGGSLNDWPLPAICLFPEIEITGGQRGLGRVGGDFWPVLKDKNGRRRGYVWDTYPQSMWHSCQLQSHVLNPGPTGPVATARYEALREGLQHCEARIAIETALTNDALKARLGPDLANRCQKLLDDRIWEELKAFSGLQLTGRIYTTYQHYSSIFYYNAGGTGGSLWYAGSGWQDRTQQLYQLAGEVQKKLAAN